MAASNTHNMLSNDADDEPKKIGTRVFKKSSPNGKITTYLGKRDYIDYMSYIEPIDGVVLIDPEYVKDRKVYAHVLAAFRYGRDDLDVLGLTFRKDLFIAQQQVYPQLEPPKNLTHLQQRLLRKLGPNAYPFFFQIPKNAPASVTLQPAPGDTGKPCGVDYELKAYCADDLEEKPHKRNSVRLAIRKLTYAPPSRAPQPMVDAHREFMMSPAPLHLECTLDKEMYYHGESIIVNVQVTNNSNKTVKKIRITVIQTSEIMLYSATQYKCEVAELESTDGFPINPSSTMSKVYNLTPLLANNKDKRGLALDGKLKHEDTNLASSTIINDPSEKENLGIIVQYRVKVKLIVSMGGDLSVELPFTLTHPKPEQPPPQSPIETSNTTTTTQDNNTKNTKPHTNGSDQTVPVDLNLIEFDTNSINGNKATTNGDDDLIFEEFARIRLKGHDADDTDV
jgi:beta-arrestin